MCDITRSFLATMGESGAGIVRHDEVDETLKNSFVDTWSKYFTNLLVAVTLDQLLSLLTEDVVKPKAPWFFEIRALIDKRPNLVPAGLGNSQTAIDGDIILNPSGGGGEEEIRRGAAGEDGVDASEVEVEDGGVGEEDGGLDDEDDDDDELPAKVSTTVPAKRTAPEPDRSTTPAQAHTATSKKPVIDTNPAPPPKKPKKPKVNDFLDVVVAEEATQKSAHELAKAKVERDRAKHQNKADVARDVLAYKRDKQRTKALRAEAELERMRMRRMRMEQQGNGSSQNAAPSSRSVTRTNSPVPYAPPNAQARDTGHNNAFGAMDFVADNNFIGFDENLAIYGGGQDFVLGVGGLNGGLEGQ